MASHRKSCIMSNTLYIPTKHNVFLAYASFKFFLPSVLFFVRRFLISFSISPISTTTSSFIFNFPLNHFVYSQINVNTYCRSTHYKTGHRIGNIRHSHCPSRICLRRRVSVYKPSRRHTSIVLFFVFDYHNIHHMQSLKFPHT